MVDRKLADGTRKRLADRETPATTPAARKQNDGETQARIAAALGVPLISADQRPADRETPTTLGDRVEFWRACAIEWQARARELEGQARDRQRWVEMQDRRIATLTRERDEARFERDTYIVAHNELEEQVKASCTECSALWDCRLQGADRCPVCDLRAQRDEAVALLRRMVVHCSKLLGFANLDDEDHASVCGDIEAARHLGACCDDDCPGYREEPSPCDLWPGEPWRPSPGKEGERPLSKLPTPSPMASFREIDAWLLSRGWTPEANCWRSEHRGRVTIATFSEAQKIQRRRDAAAPGAGKGSGRG